MSIADADIAAAARLLGVAPTDAERAQMAPGLARQRDRALRLRALALPRDLPPATRFDPRLPGAAPPPPPGPAAPFPDPGPLPACSEDIAFAPAHAQRAWLADGRLAARRLVALFLDRIERIDGRLLAFARVAGEAAIAQAEALDAERARTGRPVGPLHGLPYGMKDIVDTAGLVTDWGAEPFRGRVPDADAHVTTALRAAGAILLGKTAVGALAYGDLWHGGRTRNPWNTGQGASGSSAGSASAVAAGLCAFAIGTETYGSIVSPAARCRCAGLRPTFGRVSRRGVMALCPSLDKVGVLARDPRDTAIVLAAIATPDPLDPAQIGPPDAPSFVLPPALASGARIGVRDDELDPATRAELAARAAAAGAVLQDLPPRPDLPWDALVAILDAEAAASFEELTLSDRDDELAWQDEAAWPNSFRRARFLSAVDHVQLDRFRRCAMEHVADDLARVDAVATSPDRGPLLLLGNFTGHPCACLPGFGPDRAASVTLLGRLFDEARLLALAAVLHDRGPSEDLRPASAMVDVIQTDDAAASPAR